jgi:hypothetical protein
MSGSERDGLDPLLARATRALRDEPSASAHDVGRVMARVRARPRPEVDGAVQVLPASRARVHRRWYIASGIAAAAVVVLVTGEVRRSAVPVARDPNDTLAPGEIAGSTPLRTRDVRFMLDAPGASRVAVAGDFNHWQPVPLRREGGDGHWVVTLPIADGTYSYSFVVEDRRWVADPVAPAAPGDGFGAPSSVLIVEGHVARKGST